MVLSGNVACQGGAILSSNTLLQVASGTLLSGNQAYQGGAMFAFATSQLALAVVAGCKFYNNTAADHCPTSWYQSQGGSDISKVAPRGSDGVRRFFQVEGYQLMAGGGMFVSGIATYIGGSALIENDADYGPAMFFVAKAAPEISASDVAVLSTVDDAYSGLRLCRRRLVLTVEGKAIDEGVLARDGCSGGSLLHGYI